MACPHCGCRLVSRADPSAESGSRGGASRGTLVCSRCAHPIEQRQDPASRRLRLGHAATLLSLARSLEDRSQALRLAQPSTPLVDACAALGLAGWLFDRTEQGATA